MSAYIVYGKGGITSALMNAKSTALLSGGAISINGGDPAKYDIAAGSGVVVDNYTDPTAPIYTPVTWDAFSTQTVADLVGTTHTTIGIDSSGAIKEIDWTDKNEELRDYILLGTLVHPNNTTIESVENIPANIGIDTGLQLYDLGEAVGPINQSGNVFSSNGANLKLDKSAGVLHKVGSNYHTNRKDSSNLPVAATSPTDFYYTNQDGLGDYFTTPATTQDIVPGIYDSGVVNPNSYILATSTEQKVTASDAEGGDLLGIDVSISGDVAIAGASEESGEGAAYIKRLNRSNGLWEEEQKLVASDGTAGDGFGIGVSISGTVAIVGAHKGDGNVADSGSAYIYRYNGTNWDEEQKITASDGTLNDWFGYSVSISGDVAIVGAWKDGGGSVYFYRYNGSTWVETQKIAGTERFGYDVSLDDLDEDVAIIGTNSSATISSAFIYRHNGSTWVEEQELTASDGVMGDFFGRAVSIEGDVCIVGAIYDDDKGVNSGSAYIYRFNGSTWDEEDKLTASDGVANDNFGHGVGISGTVAIVGTYKETSFQGAAYIYEYDGVSAWGEKEKIEASDGFNHDWLGYNVAISGDRFLTGAHQDDDDGSKSGSVYFYHIRRDYGATGVVAANEWSVQRLYTTGATTYVHYGQAVYSSKEAALVGVYEEGLSTNSDLDDALLRGYLVVKGDATDLSDSSQAVFIEANKWGQPTPAGYGNASQIAVPVLGDATFTTLEEIDNLTASSGITSWAGITDNGDGTANISGGTGLIRNADSDIALLSTFDFPAVTSQVLTDEALNYIYIDYNAGVPVITVSLTRPTEQHTKILLAHIRRDGTVLHITDQIQFIVADHSAKILERVLETDPFSRSEGGIISETGTRNISVTAGVWWEGLVRFTTAAFDSSVSDTFTCYYSDGAGGWTAVTSQTVINNTQYDDGSGILATLGNSKYGVHWIYLGMDGDVYSVFGTGSYNLADAEGAGIPASIPPHISSGHGRVIGKIVIQKDATTFTEIASTFDTTITPSAASDHEDLTGIQGGSTGEHYHLTSAEHAEVQALTDPNTELKIDYTATANDQHALLIIADAAGYAGFDAIDIDYITGTLAAEEEDGVILINIDESDATGGEVVGLEVLATEGSASVYAVRAGPLVGPIQQEAGSFGDMDSALVNATDRLTEFTTPGSDVEFFSADNDTITIGAAAKFGSIEFLLATGASRDCNIIFEHSTGIGTWASFVPTDGTNGMRNTGVIIWDPLNLGTWTTGIGGEYLIRLTRTRNSLSTAPIESKVQISDITDYHWDKDGKLLVNQVNLTGDLVQETQTTPASASAPGVKGTIVHDSNYIYICVATDTWKRVAISTW